MKYILTILLGAITFFAPAQVTLSDSVARFYFERHFYAKSLEKQNNLLNLLVENQDKIIYKQDSLIQNYEHTETVHSLLDDNLRLQIQERIEENDTLRKKIRNRNILIGLIIIFTTITL